MWAHIQGRTVDQRSAGIHCSTLSLAHLLFFLSAIARTEERCKDIQIEISLKTVSQPIVLLLLYDYFQQITVLRNGYRENYIVSYDWKDVQWC